MRYRNDTATATATMPTKTKGVFFRSFLARDSRAGHLRYDDARRRKSTVEVFIHNFLGAHLVLLFKRNHGMAGF